MREPTHSGYGPVARSPDSGSIRSPEPILITRWVAMRKALKVISSLLMCCTAAAALATEADTSNTLRLYNWTDYIGENTLADFEKQTGIKVIYDTFDGYETVQTKLLTGRSGYDLVMLNGSLVPPLIKAGVFQPLDKTKLPSWANLDPHVVQSLQAFDPGMVYSAPYTWGSSGITYNVDKIRQRMPDAPIGSLAMLFDPRSSRASPTAASP